MDIDFDAVLRFAKTLEGRPYNYAAKAVQSRGGDLLEFTPQSSGKPRTQGRSFGGSQEVLDRYNLTHSLRTTDYQDITMNSSYLLTVVALMVGSEDRSV